MTQVKLAPLGDRVLVRPLKEEVTKGGIYIPETAQDTPECGVVVRVGSGKRLDNGQVSAVGVAIGQKVVYGKYAGTKVKVGVEELLFMREEDIMGVYED
ncbi:MAG: co-chaperone GroES [Pseudomonadota bacterium]